jgi:hypothetical protein
MTRKEMGSFVRDPNKPAATAGNIFGKLNLKSKQCFNFHMAWLGCKLGADCKDDHIPLPTQLGSNGSTGGYLLAESGISQSCLFGYTTALLMIDKKYFLSSMAAHA